MLTSPAFPLRVFYDGSCLICSLEINRYSRMDRSGRLQLVDISAPEFDPSSYGISLDEFMYQLHTIDRNGRIYRGVESFWAIWQAFPSSTLLGLGGFFLQLPLITPLARLFYHFFARVRGYLPKRRHVCSHGSCQLSRK